MHLRCAHSPIDTHQLRLSRSSAHFQISVSCATTLLRKGLWRCKEHRNGNFNRACRLKLQTCTVKIDAVLPVVFRFCKSTKLGLTKHWMSGSHGKNDNDRPIRPLMAANSCPQRQLFKSTQVHCATSAFVTEEHDSDKLLHCGSFRCHQRLL